MGERIVLVKNRINLKKKTKYPVSKIYSAIKIEYELQLYAQESTDNYLTSDHIYGDDDDKRMVHTRTLHNFDKMPSP